MEDFVCDSGCESSQDLSLSDREGLLFIFLRNVAKEDHSVLNVQVFSLVDHVLETLDKSIGVALPVIPHETLQLVQDAVVKGAVDEGLLRLSLEQSDEHLG